MNNLISRMAAIEAFTSKPPEYYHISYIVSELNNVPAANVMSVGWLREKMNWADDNDEMNNVNCLSWLIQTWKKEQETR